MNYQNAIEKPKDPPPKPQKLQENNNREKTRSITPKKFSPPEIVKVQEEKNTNHNNIFDEYLSILKEIFNQMDDDNDGVITAENIDLSSVDPAFLEIIQDLLLKVDEEKCSLNFQGFLNAIEENHLEVKIHGVFNYKYGFYIRFFFSG